MLVRKHSHVSPALLHPPRGVSGNRSTSTQGTRQAARKLATGGEARCTTPTDFHRPACRVRKTTQPADDGRLSAARTKLAQSKPPVAPRDYSDYLDTSFPSVSTAESSSFQSDQCRTKLRTPSPAETRGYMQQISKQFQLDKVALASAVQGYRTHSSGPSLDLSAAAKTQGRSASSRRTCSIYWGQ